MLGFAEVCARRREAEAHPAVAPRNCRRFTGPLYGIRPRDSHPLRPVLRFAFRVGKEAPLVSRRAFLQASAVCSSAAAVEPFAVFADTSKPSGYFGVHPFVEQHAEAVFI